MFVCKILKGTDVWKLGSRSEITMKPAEIHHKIDFKITKVIQRSFFTIKERLIPKFSNIHK